MKNTFKKVWNIISSVLVTIVVLCAIFLMGSRILGYQVYTVLSGSMEPNYSVGDLLYVKETDVSTIKVGDPITFILNEELVVATHRVVRIDAEKQHFYTKGDANETEDSSPVHFKNVIGVPKFSIPLLGYVSNYIQNPPGMYVTIGAGVVVVILVFLPDMLNKKKDENKPESTEENSSDQ
ncbi:MAG: signal peptidase I [Ruminococcaceae bacterium]|nr:signal peptidase I [Oscillospiraceae bacterium]